MKKIIIVITVFIFLGNSYSQYISPGVRVGYDFSSHFTFGLKISFGIYNSGDFVNLTYGKKFAIGQKSTYANHNYIDLQLGKLTETLGNRKLQIYYGGGIGIIFYKNKNMWHYSPRLTTFAGNFFFTTFDLNFIKWKKLEPDIGFQLVLPIPLGEKPSLGTGG